MPKSANRRGGSLILDSHKIYTVWIALPTNEVSACVCARILGLLRGNMRKGLAGLFVFGFLLSLVAVVTPRAWAGECDPDLPEWACDPDDSDPGDDPDESDVLAELLSNSQIVAQLLDLKKKDMNKGAFYKAGKAFVAMMDNLAVADPDNEESYVEASVESGNYQLNLGDDNGSKGDLVDGLIDWAAAFYETSCDDFLDTDAASDVASGALTAFKNFTKGLKKVKKSALSDSIEMLEEMKENLSSCDDDFEDE